MTGRCPTDQAPESPLCLNANSARGPCCWSVSSLSI